MHRTRSNVNYAEVVMKQLPYKVLTDKKVLHDAEAWCIKLWGPRWEAIGNREGTWCVFWGGNRVELLPYHYEWNFETNEQKMMFVLRWS
jgi:hypothetical protein